MIIKCPHCSHQGKIDASRIPPNGVNARCPACKGGFPVRRSDVRETEHPTPKTAPLQGESPASASPPPGHAAPATAGMPSAAPAPPVAPSTPPEPALNFKDSPSSPAGQPQQPAGAGGLSLKDPSPEAVQSKSAACTGCLKLFNENELAQSEDRKLCPSCLEAFKQKGQTPVQGNAARRASPAGVSRKKDLDYAGFWIRVGAYLVDGVLLVLVWHFLLSPIIMKAGMSMFSETALPAAMSLPQDGTMDPAQMEAAIAQMQEAMNSVSTRMITWVYITQFIALVFFGGYFVLMEGSSGQTIGKKALALRVVNPEGESIGYLKAFARYVGKIISSVILGIGFVIAAFDSEKRALHDHMVNSRVIRE